MIKKFGSLFAGHVDFESVGFDAPPVNDRWLSDEDLGGVFDKATSIAKTLDSTGFDTFWLAEHHFQREGHEAIPNILMLAVHLAHLTDKVKFGCGFNILPAWHPLRLAEDFAMADRLTGGRVIFGIGRGYHTREVETLGAPMVDKDANRELFEEQVEVLFKALNEPSFSHHGKHYDIPPKIQYRGYELEQITLVPAPLNRPVDCWQPIVSGSKSALDLMVKYGIKGMIGGGAAAGGAHDSTVAAWRDALVRGGREEAVLGEDLIIGLAVFIGESKEKAVVEASKYFEENMKMFAPLGFVGGITDEQITAMSDTTRIHSASLPTLWDAANAGSWLVGTPDDVIEGLSAYQERFPGLEHVNVGQVVGTPEQVIVEQLQRFSEDVMPVFKR